MEADVIAHDGSAAKRFCRRGLRGLRNALHPSYRSFGGSGGNAQRPAGRVGRDGVARARGSIRSENLCSLPQTGYAEQAVRQ